MDRRRVEFRFFRRNSGSSEVEFGRRGGFHLTGAMAVRAVCLAGPGTGSQRLVNDRLDGPGATSAFGAAAQAPIDLLGIARQFISRRNGTADIVIGNDVTGADNH